MNTELTTLQKVIDTVVDFLVRYSFQVVAALIILVVGWMASLWCQNLVQSFCKKKHVDVTLTTFVGALTKIVVFSFAVIIALGKFGVTITPFIAAIGAAAFGATYAIQGPLSNYAAGLSLILSRPFSVGKTISVAGVSGVVKNISLSTTLLEAADGQFITVPNKHIVGEILYSSEIHKIIEGSIGISYDSDPERATKIIADTLMQFQDVAKNPAPQVGIQSFGDFSINISFRYWVPTVKYFDTLHGVNLGVFRALQKASIKIPYPQHEVRMIQP